MHDLIDDAEYGPDYEKFDFNDAALAHRGVKVTGAEHGTDNVIYIHRESGPITVEIILRSGTQNTGKVGPRALSTIKLNFDGDLNRYEDAGERTWPWMCTALYRKKGGSFTIGQGSTCYGMVASIQGPDGHVSIGKDCMMSNTISLRPSDVHAIIFLMDRTIVNPPEPIIIGDHVWIGERATIMKGVSIGKGAIVGGSSLVTKDVAVCSLVVGNPARELKTKVSWTRASIPNDAQLSELFDILEI